MADKKDHTNKFAASHAPENTKKMSNDGKLSVLIAYLHSANVLQFLLGASQVILGIAVVIISVLGLIRPLWLSTLFSIGASITTMIGAYVCYTAWTGWGQKALLRDAMRRIVEAQN